VAGRAAARWAATYLHWGDRKREKRRQFVIRTGEDVTRTMGDMKGAAMKLGQVLSLMSGVVPEEMSSQLATLQSNAPPMAYRLVQGVFEEEFGAPPERLFKRFEHEPFAAASIGQVHRAVLRDGSPVAVKVQYPGVGEAISSDLANVGLMLGMAGRFAQGLDTATIVRDLKDGIVAELDYEREAADQRRFFDLFEGHAFIRVPRVVDELSTKRVLTQELLAGKPFRAALELDQPERDRVAEIIYRFAFGSLYRHRLFNGDPHPGNYLLLDDGSVGFVDYGVVSEFPVATLDGFERVLRALIRGDLPGWRAGVEEIGILRRGAPFTTQELYAHMHWYWAPILDEYVTFTPELAAEMVRRNTQTTGEGGRINRHCNIPEGMVFLTRINFGLAGVLASLRATGPWRGIIEEYIDGKPPVSELGELSAATTRHGPSV
jgi:predicted unusual protein kinase regulating ubiquinone biosynthesis (AarF/ABC1/UbiB family)